MVHLKSAQAAGDTTKDTWLQTLSYTTSTTFKPLTQGYALFVVVAIQTDLAASHGKRLINQLETLTQENQAALTPGQLRQLLQDIHHEDITHHLALAYVSPKTLVIGGLGNTTAILKRDDQTGVIFEGAGNQPKLITGKWQHHDRLLLATKEFINQLNAPLKEQSFNLTDVEALQANWNQYLKDQDDSSTQAGVLVDFSPERDVKATGTESEPEEISPPKASPDQDETLETQPDKEPEPNLPKVYLKSHKRKKRFLSIGIITLIMIGISVYFGYQQRQKMLWQNRYDQLVQQVDQLTTQAAAAQNSNPSQTRELFQQAIGTVDTAIPEFESRPELQQQLHSKKSSLQSQFQELANENTLTNVSAWYDLNIIREGLFGNRLTLTDTFLVVTDAEQSVIARINLLKKSGDLVGGGNLFQNIQDIAAEGSRAVALTDNTVVETNMNTKTPGLLVEADDMWENPQSLGFYNGNVYILDTGVSEIWRYPGLIQGVGSRQRWLGPGIQPNFESVVDIAIDGSIWVLSSDGSLRQYLQGAPQPFSLEDSDPPLNSAQAIFTTVDEDLLYILDTQDNRIIIFNKDGQYQKQVRWDGLTTATDFAVYENQAYILSGPNLYQLSLE